MTYLMFNDEGEFIDILQIDSLTELNLFNENNPDIILKTENDFNDLDEFFSDDDEIDE